jgi:hypothetical protein
VSLDRGYDEIAPRLLSVARQQRRAATFPPWKKHIRFMQRFWGAARCDDAPHPYQRLNAVYRESGAGTLRDRAP